MTQPDADPTALPGGTFAEAGVPSPLGRALFDAARAYHQLRPWRVLDDAASLELELPGQEPITAIVLGAAGEAFGLALFHHADDVRKLRTGDPGDAAAVRSLSVTFAPRAEAPDSLVAEASAGRWPVAGAGAFPIAIVTTGADAPPRLPNHGEAELLLVALRAVVRFCGRHGRALRMNADLTGAESVATGSGERIIVRVRTVTHLFTDEPDPFGAGGGGAPEFDDETGGSTANPDEFDDLDVDDLDDDDLDDDDLDDDDLDDDDLDDGNRAETARVHAAGVHAAGRRGGFLPEIDQLRTLTLELPASRATLQRLRWGFFLAPGAFHVEDADQDMAGLRFLDWALFAARVPPDGRTLTQQALDRATGLDGIERERLRSIARPRYGIYRVLRVERDVGMTVRALSDDSTLFIREGRGTRQLRRGQVLIGPLHPDGDGLVIMSGACVVYPRLVEGRAQGVTGDDTGDAAGPAIEQGLFGAATDWIQEIETPTELRRAYESFAASLKATGTLLPGLGRLQRMVREHDSPAALLQSAVGDVTWWNEFEPGVFMAFLQRVWNVTPRPEIGGRSPEQAAGRGTRSPPGRRR